MTILLLITLAQQLPTPPVPPGSPALIELGRHLFYDKRLSANGQQSCATCHQQRLAFTDGRARALGSTGQLHPRSSMSLVNVAYSPALTWSNANLHSLEEQAEVPMFGQDPVELGLPNPPAGLLANLRAAPVYQRLFRAAFPGDADPGDADQLRSPRLTQALAAFERSIVSTRSPYDRYRYQHDESAISSSAKRGEKLFFSSEKAGCFQCHNGWNFSGPVRHTGNPNAAAELTNTGLGTGIFRAPTLRNIAVTAPYMHDGRFATLAEVLDHYAQGGGGENPAGKSKILRAFPLSPSDREDLLEFLNSLTDPALLEDPRWSDPWQTTKAKPQ
jgi:cytochrome c peroxidase